MSYKSDKLGQRIPQLQDYIISKGAAHPVLKEVQDELPSLADTLNQGKLTINLIATQDGWASLLEQYFSQQTSLAEGFVTQVEDSPWQLAESQVETPPTILLQNPEASAKGVSQYQLSPDLPIIVGRDPGRATLLVTDRINMVSGSHASFKRAEAPNKKGMPSEWQVCDNNSTNGTFVNGQRIFGCQTLVSGDQIILGGATPEANRAVFVFEYNPVDHTALERLYQRVHSCDVLMAIVGPAQIESQVTQDLISKNSKAGLSKLYLVVMGEPVPAVTSQKLQALAQPLKVPLEIIPLPLPADATIPSNIVGFPAEWQTILSKMSSDMVAFSARKVEDILVNRLTLQLNALVVRIDSVLITQEETLRLQFERENQMLNGIGVDELRERMRGLLTKAKEEKDLFFRQVRVDLNSAKTSVLDPHAKRGIQGKIKQFTDELVPAVVVKKGIKQVLLKPAENSSSENIDLIAFQFCQKELGEWVNREWDRTLTEYAAGGLNGLLQRLSSNLTVTASVINVDAINQPIPPPNLTRSLQESILGRAREEPLNEDSFGGYIMKKFRNAWMMIGSLVALGGTILLPLMKRLLPDPENAPKGPRGDWFSTLLQKAPYLQIPVYLGLILFVLYLIRDYKINRKLALEELGTKLKTDLCSYYQSFAKDRIDRLLQEILLALEAEDQRLKSAMGRIEEQLSVQVGDIRKKLDEIKTRQQLIAKERGDVKRLVL